MTALSVENLYDLTGDAVVAQVPTAFVALLQTSPSVHQTFFASVAAPAVAAQNPDWVDSVAAALACSGISRSSLYGFAATVNQNAADNWWQTQLASQSGLAESQSLYQWAFPAYCSDGNGTSFQEYCGADAGSWAQQLAAHVTTDEFLNVELNKLISADPNWLYKVNLLYYKLHLLDPAQEQTVVAAFTGAYQGAVEQWQSYNYLNGVLQPDAWLGAVNSQIGVDTQTPPGRAGQPIENSYGNAVVGFLGGKPSALRLTTGQDPQNVVYNYDGGGGGGCFVPGSPVHLEDGTTIPIERLAKGHRVLARDGAVGEHTEERVVEEIHASMPVYGINDDEPFFSAGHLLWTREGWKAIEPSIAEEENPSRRIGKLEPGDTVLRLRGGTGPGYDEIKIDKIPSKLVPAGSHLHGAHLDGAASYHVHGYVVGMNYPMITEKRLADGFATLTASERAQLASTLAPVMPLLRKAVGPFVEEPIRRALTTDPP